jgi:hypothetical protein
MALDPSITSTKAYRHTSLDQAIRGARDDSFVKPQTGTAKTSFKLGYSSNIGKLKYNLQSEATRSSENRRIITQLSSTMKTSATKIAYDRMHEYFSEMRTQRPNDPSFSREAEHEAILDQREKIIDKVGKMTTTAFFGTTAKDAQIGIPRVTVGQVKETATKVDEFVNKMVSDFLGTSVATVASNRLRESDPSPSLYVAMMGRFVDDHAPKVDGNIGGDARHLPKMPGDQIHAGMDVSQLKVFSSLGTTAASRLNTESCPHGLRTGGEFRTAMNAEIGGRTRSGELLLHPHATGTKGMGQLSPFIAVGLALDNYRDRGSGMGERLTLYALGRTGVDGTALSASDMPRSPELVREEDFPRSRKGREDFERATQKYNDEYAKAGNDRTAVMLDRIANVFMPLDGPLQLSTQDSIAFGEALIALDSRLSACATEPERRAVLEEKHQLLTDTYDRAYALLLTGTDAIQVRDTLHNAVV